MSLQLKTKTLQTRQVAQMPRLTHTKHFVRNNGSGALDKERMGAGRRGRGEEGGGEVRG